MPPKPRLGKGPRFKCEAPPAQACPGLAPTRPGLAGEQRHPPKSAQEGAGHGRSSAAVVPGRPGAGLRVTEPRAEPIPARGAAARRRLERPRLPGVQRGARPRRAAMLSE